MSTSAMIAVQHEDKSITSVNVHWDGTLEYVGAVLKKFYSSKEFAEQLVIRGDISSLGLTLNTSGSEKAIFVPIEGIESNVSVYTSYIESEEVRINKYQDADEFNEFVDRYLPKYEYVFIYIEDERSWWYSVDDRKSYLEV